MEKDDFLALYQRIMGQAAMVSELAVSGEELEQRADLLTKQKGDLQAFEDNFARMELTKSMRKEMRKHVDICKESFAFQWENMPWEKLKKH